jgi:hypothetical protein
MRLYIHFLLWMYCPHASRLFPVTYSFVVKEATCTVCQGEQTYGSRTRITRTLHGLRAAGILNGSTIPVVLNRFIILCGRLPQRREDKSEKIIPVLLIQKLFAVITRDIIIQTLGTFCSES